MCLNACKSSDNWLVRLPRRSCMWRWDTAGNSRWRALWARTGQPSTARPMRARSLLWCLRQMACTASLQALTPASASGTSQTTGDSTDPCWSTCMRSYRCRKPALQYIRGRPEIVHTLAAILWSTTPAPSTGLKRCSLRKYCFNTYTLTLLF